jgi:penicillin-binding protein 1A
MGYDDNTPLTGVTGGGLPAEIWRETMTRLGPAGPGRALPVYREPAPAPVVSEEDESVLAEIVDSVVRAFRAGE